MRRRVFRGAMLWGVLLAAAALTAHVLAEDGGTGSLHDLAQSATQGSAAAQYELGVAYANGDGVAADYAQAARWFAQAARNGNAEARRQLAFMAQLGLAAPAPLVAAPGGTFRVQVASVASEADGAREWHRLQRLHPDALGHLSMAVEQFDAPTGDRLFQVEGGPLDEDDALAICGRLRAAGATCRVVHPAP